MSIYRLAYACPACSARLCRYCRKDGATNRAPLAGPIRWGHAAYSAAELKTMQEVITLSVFAAFSVLYLGERITLNHLWASP